MQEKNILTHDMMIQYKNSLDQLSDSLLNLIRIADCLIPEELYNNGLKFYISQLCESLSKEKKIIISLSYLGDLFRLNDKTELLISRIFSSLLAFITDQINPDEIEIEIHQTSDNFEIITTDNGYELNFLCLTSSGVNELAQIKTLIETIPGTFSYNRSGKYQNKIVISLPIKS